MVYHAEHVTADQANKPLMCDNADKIISLNGNLHTCVFLQWVLPSSLILHQVSTPPPCVHCWLADQLRPLVDVVLHMVLLHEQGNEAVSDQVLNRLKVIFSCMHACKAHTSDQLERSRECNPHAA